MCYNSFGLAPKIPKGQQIMKKIAFFVVVMLLAIVLVACGGDETTTTKAPTTTTTPTITTTAPKTETTTAPKTETTTDPKTETTTAPKTEGENLIDDYDCIDIMDTNTMSFMMFEDFHVDLDYNVALVIRMNENGAIYPDFFITMMDEETGEPTGEYTINDAYKHVIVLDGKPFEISRITLANYTTSGWVRFDLGADFKFSDYEYDENGIHYFTAIWNVYDEDGKLAYYANLTEYNIDGGKYPHKKPQDKVVVADPDVPAGVERVQNKDITLISAPSVGNGESADNMFDDKAATKFCTGDNGPDKAIIVGFASEQTLIGISFVNGNDNESYVNRTLVDFEIYVSADGNTWNSVADFVSTSEGVDKNTICNNYTENYYGFGKTLTCNYIKIVANNGDTYQISEMIFYAG